MKQFNKYHILKTDQFKAENFSAVNAEVHSINEKTNAYPPFFKMEIIISFLKNHSLQTNWINANPELTKLVISGTLFTGGIESLFESSRDNPVFRKGLETYLKERFTNFESVRAFMA